VGHGEEREEGRALGAGARRVRDVRWQAELAKGAGGGKEEKREGEGRKENRKEKEKMEKRKERKRREKKRRAGFAALPMLGRPRAAPGRASAARGSRETQGARYSVGSDSPGIGRLEQEGFREVRVRVFQGESSSTKNNFSARFNLVNFRDVKMNLVLEIRLIPKQMGKFLLQGVFAFPCRLFHTVSAPLDPADSHFGVSGSSGDSI